MLARSEWSTLAVATLALIFSAGAQLSQPLYFGKIIQVCSSHESTEERMHKLYQYSFTLAAILAFGGVFTVIRGWLFTLVGERLVRSLRTDLFKQIVGQDIAFFDTNKTGELMNRLSSDTAAIQNCLSVNISMGLRAIAEVIVSIVLLFIVSWHLTLVMMAVVPLLMLIVVIYGRFTKRLTKDYQDALALAADSGTESLSNARIMKSFGAEEWEGRLYADNIHKSFERGASRALAYGVFAGGIGFLAGMAILVVVFYGATLVIQGELEVGDLTSFILYTIYIAVGLGIFSGLYTELMNAIGASER
jgi:ABC-type multidrug transport system fused ATPase/permease subunit